MTNHVAGFGAFSTGGRGAAAGPAAAGAIVALQPVEQPVAQGAAVAQQVAAGAQQLCRGVWQQRVFAGLQHRCRPPQWRASAVSLLIANATPNANAKPNKRFILISFNPETFQTQAADPRRTNLPQQFCP